MNPENASTLGYVVLLAGIALSVIGYVIYLNLRGDKAGDSSEDSEDEAEIKTDGSVEISSDEFEKEDLDDDPAAETAMGIVDQDSEEPQEESAEILEEGMESVIIDDEEAVPTFVVPDEPELIPAATLLREGVSGRIVVKVGDRQYLDIESLKNSKDWSRVRSLSTDLASWIEDKPSSSALQGEREDVDLAPSSDSQASDSDSMIVQINRIINKKVETMEGEEREIKLVEGAIGALEVRVGVEKFPIDEVPYANVRELIQDAVSQWENSQ
jgi:hypothetical protein